MNIVVARCRALSADGGFCEAALDVSPGIEGEHRWCTDHLHRWSWHLGRWSHDVDQPAAPGLPPVAA